MSNFTLSELKTLVLNVITVDQAREYGDLRKRSTWETAYSAHVGIVIEPVQVTDGDLAEMTVDNVDRVPFEAATPATPASDPALTWSEVGSIAATTAVATAIVVADYGQVVWSKAKALWTITEPVILQGMFFTVVLAIFFYWFTASAVQKFYLAIEWSFLQLVQDTSPANVLVHDGWSIDTEDTLLLAPCEAS